MFGAHDSIGPSNSKEPFGYPGTPGGGHTGAEPVLTPVNPGSKAITPEVVLSPPFWEDWDTVDNTVMTPCD